MNVVNYYNRIALDTVNCHGFYTRLITLFEIIHLFTIHICFIVSLLFTYVDQIQYKTFNEKLRVKLI